MRSRRTRFDLCQISELKRSVDFPALWWFSFKIPTIVPCKIWPAFKWRDRPSDSLMSPRTHDHKRSEQKPSNYLHTRDDGPRKNFNYETIYDYCIGARRELLRKITSSIEEKGKVRLGTNCCIDLHIEVCHNAKTVLSD